MRGKNRTERVCDSKYSKKPVLLKTRGHSRCLEVKLGNLEVELWDFPYDKAKPYARLLFEPDRIGDRDAAIEMGKAGTRLHADLDVMEGGTISVAIEQWLLSFESRTRDSSSPSIHMRIASLSIDLYRERDGEGTRTEIVASAQNGLSGKAVLTRLETSLLGTLLESLVDDEKADCQEFVG